MQETLPKPHIAVCRLLKEQKRLFERRFQLILCIFIFSSLLQNRFNSDANTLEPTRALQAAFGKEKKKKSEKMKEF